MTTRDYQVGIDELRGVLDSAIPELSNRAVLLAQPLTSELISRVTQAIGEGMSILDGECHRRLSAVPQPSGGWSDASLMRALEIDLSREDNVALRWLSISYWVVLCNFDAVASTLEPLVVSNLENLVWLVGGALWVQWVAGQPTTQQLRVALVRVRTCQPSLDAYLAAQIAGRPSAARDGAKIAQLLLADVAAAL